MTAIERLDEITARLNAATPGPWATEKAIPFVGMWIIHAVRKQTLDAEIVGGIERDADARLAIHAPTDIADTVAALRAVLELHTRKYDTYYMTGVCSTCGEFGEYAVRWPCPTVRAIAKALEDS